MLVIFRLCTKRSHAPKYSEVEFLGYHMKVLAFARLLHSHCRQNTSFAIFFEIDNGEWHSHLHSHNFDEGILFQSNPISLNGQVCHTSHISSMETYPIPKVFLSKQTRVHLPWVSVTITKSLALIKWTDWRLMRHSLRKKTS